jgi:hypothetical protein
MKAKEEWKPIDVYGLSRYEISTTGIVRTIHHRNVQRKVNVKGREYVILVKYGRKYVAEMRDLMWRTFKIVYGQTEEDRLKAKGKEDFVHDKDENEYGKGINSRHWAELKKEIERLKRNGMM